MCIVASDRGEGHFVIIIFLSRLVMDDDPGVN